MLKKLTIKNLGKIIIGNLNVNSLVNKFEELKFIVKDNVDILILTETKLDD